MEFQFEHLINDPLNMIRNQKQAALFLAEKALANGTVEQSEKRIEIARDVDQSYRLGVNPQLRPGERFKQLLECPDPAWKCDESVS